MRPERGDADRWVECWGAAFDAGGGVSWWTGPARQHGGSGWYFRARFRDRHDFKTPGAAAKWIATLHDVTNVYAKRWWKRKRPKPKRGLRVGDEVLVLCRVAAEEDQCGRIICMPIPSGTSFEVRMEHIRR